MIVNHKLSYARQVYSPNQSERPAKAQIELLVLHNISLPPGQYGTGNIEQFFCNRLCAEDHPYFQEIVALQVSAHLLIERTGEIVQFVPFGMKAWHAGLSEFEGRQNCNEFSIGIELEGCDDEPFTDVQYSALAQVTSTLMQQYPAIVPDRIVGHSDIAPGRKTDPGPHFDWQRFHTLCRAQTLDKHLEDRP